LVWVDLADALSEQKRWAEAIEALQRALALEEGCVEAHRRLAELFQRTGNRAQRSHGALQSRFAFLAPRKTRPEAVQAFERTLALNPNNGRLGTP
jgi:tetratricopeptide (TPR) repeat protein